MSTRSTTHFLYGQNEKPEAIIYRHSDGYPEGAGRDLRRFLDECAALEDSRFNDPSYLAAKYVVFLARKMRDGHRKMMTSLGYPLPDPPSELDFLSVGVMSTDPEDIEYRYEVRCSGDFGDSPRPEIRCYSIGRQQYVDPFGDEPEKEEAP